MPEPSLLDELGLDERTVSWHHLALCGGRTPGEEGMDLNWFFDDYEADSQFAITMDEVCLSCPVMKACFFDAVENKDSGLRGAIYMNKGRPDRKQNAHKTPEVWKRIQEKLRED